MISITLQHSHIGLDLDETLAATFDGFLAYAHSLWKLTDIHSKEEICVHDVSKLQQGITLEEAIALWEGYGQTTMNPESVPSVEGSQEWVKKFFDAGKRISIVTARSNQDSWRIERTLSWINSHFPYLGEESVHFVNHFSTEARPKSMVCKDYDITLMIDDAIENAYELCDAGIYTILLEKPWNRDIVYEHPLLTRVKHWGEI